LASFCLCFSTEPNLPQVLKPTSEASYELRVNVSVLNGDLETFSILNLQLVKIAIV
jgi:hypothetical protein